MEVSDFEFLSEDFDEALWNVTPLLGEFGGRVGIFRFLQSPTITRRLPSLFICRELVVYLCIIFVSMHKIVFKNCVYTQ